ncbi:galactokinase [Brevibacillus humidisoli]|uniref:galactokinase n=1 Tax=Brevibacillus humidisoli TaxID=2895522 RepID=UPI001E4664CF|nr:galactokinase [Brevibacillus humidisoli]UFJ40719.1 galactokinase [Brevibacillus humidisoli]
MGLLEQHFGSCSGEVRVFFAPGRVNLIGDHTDYSGGYVLPAALDCGTWVAIRQREDGRFRFISTNFDDQVECSAAELAYRTEDGWANYPKGVIWHLRERGVELSGGDLLFHGNIPNGAGLSSSASITMATAFSVRSLTGVDLSLMELIRLSQQVENEYLGVNCGIMDQFAVGMGRSGHGLLLRCKTLDYRYVPLTLGDYRIVIVNSNKRRELAASKYNERRAECEAGFRMIQPHLSEADHLGSVSVDQWREVSRHISSETIRRRLEHVIYENERVLRSTEALESGDPIAFGRYMQESHESLSRLYEVTGTELDVLVEEALRVKGCIGARMTGAGFGGCTVNLVHEAHLDTFCRQVNKRFRERTGRTPAFYCWQTGDGVREIIQGVEACPFW